MKEINDFIVGQHFVGMKKESFYGISRIEVMACAEIHYF